MASATFAAAIAAATIALTGCGDGAEQPETSAATAVGAPTPPTGTPTSLPTSGQVTADAAATLAANPGVVVLDVRTADEFAQGHIEGAIQLDFYRTDFAAQIDELDRDQPYLLVCRSGNRSGQTLDVMTELGFSTVYDVEGGMRAWEAAGQPVSRGD